MPFTNKWKLRKCEWSTDEKCVTCNFTGNRTDGVKHYCPICNGEGYLRKPDPDDEWFLVSSREELWDKWLEYTKKPGTYDLFVQPKEYPCLALFYSNPEPDGWRGCVRYFYRSHLPLSWSNRESDDN